MYDIIFVLAFILMLYFIATLISKLTTYIKQLVIGKIGERRIVKLIKKSKVKGYILTNLYVPHRNHLTEIDAVFVSERGIFVIESKNYKGRIYGDVNQKSWMQVLGSNTKYYFYNPVKQNISHSRAIGKLIKPYDNKLRTVIVFGNQARLRVNTKSAILTKDLPKYIKSKPKVIKDKKTLKTIYKTLKPYKRISPVKKIQHIRYVKSKKR